MGWGSTSSVGMNSETATHSDLMQRYYPATGMVESVSTDPWPGTIGGNTYTPGGCASAHNRLYCFGGWRSDIAPYFSDQTWEYDPNRAAGSRWQLLASSSLNQARGYIQVAENEGVIYAMGGVSSWDLSDLGPSDQVEALDVNDLAAGWQVLASMPVASGEGRGFAPSWTGKLYVAGGGDWPDETTTVLEYDLATDFLG